MYQTHWDFPYKGDWTVFPLLSELVKSDKNSSWVFFCEDGTVLNLGNLVDALGGHNEKADTWVGHGLVDEDPTIIHHYNFHENPRLFLYPNFASGFAISSLFLKK